MASIEPHVDFAVLVEGIGKPLVTNGCTVTAHDFALTIRESRQNGVDADAYADERGPFIELHDSRGRTYGRYRYAS